MRDIPTPLLFDNGAVIDLQGSGITASYAVGSEKDSDEERTSPQEEGPDYLHSLGVSAEQHKGEESEMLEIWWSKTIPNPVEPNLRSQTWTYGAS